MASIFSGLVQIGAWGCFDEFNRINIEVLSVVSSQLKAIQNALINKLPDVNIGPRYKIRIKRLRGFAACGVFVTMNPGYAGRTELPYNLKALFRPITMVVPDFESIAQNMLLSEGFDDSKGLAKKIVVLYKLSAEQLSKQYHYDFGLRSMKTVLIMAGSLKRKYPNLPEDVVLFKVLRDANLSTFVFEDVPLFLGLLRDLFPQERADVRETESLTKSISLFFQEKGFCSNNTQVNKEQVNKTFQLHNTQQVRHAVMVVGPSGGGKSLLIEALANATQQTDGHTVKKF